MLGKDRLYWILCSILLLALYAMGLGKSGNKSDFRDYYQASKKLQQREGIYNLKLLERLHKTIPLEKAFTPENITKIFELKNKVGTYIYPPFFAFSLLPLASVFSYETASAIFLTINFLCLLGSLFLCAKILALEQYVPLILGGILLNYRFFESHMNNNQIAFFLIFLILLAVYIDKPWLSGILLAWATAIKLTPAIFILYFLFRKKFSTIVVFTFAVVGFLLLPSFLGWEYSWKMLANWNHLVLQTAMKNPVFRAWKNNQSVIATVAKYFLAGADPISQPNFSMPFVVISNFTAKLIFYCIAFTWVGHLCYSFYKTANKFWFLSGLFILSVVLSGISWIHSFSVLLFPSLYALRVTFLQKPTWQKWLPMGFYTLVVLGTVKQFIGKGGQDFFLMFSVFLYSSLFLYAYLYVLVVQQETKGEYEEEVT
ncbi:MAG: glycosyltransferase family 87 protein [Spirochaetota bacterium]